MKEEMVTIQAYQAKCKFCDRKFVEFEAGLAKSKCAEHQHNDCPVLRCVCLTKDIEYPIAKGKGAV